MSSQAELWVAHPLPLECFGCCDPCFRCEHKPAADRALGEQSPWRYYDSVKDGVRTRYRLEDGKAKVLPL